MNRCNYCNKLLWQSVDGYMLRCKCSDYEHVIYKNNPSTWPVLGSGVLSQDKIFTKQKG